MAYINKEALVITDAASYTVEQAKALIREFHEKYPTVEGFKKRSDKNYLREWAVHALCYRWGIMKKRAKDAKLQFDMDFEVVLMYNIFGIPALWILKLVKG